MLQIYSAAYLALEAVIQAVRFRSTDYLALHNGRMNCLHCASTKTSKNGHRRSKQCYICRDCGRQFLEIYDSIGYRDSTKEHCLTLYVNGMGFRAIERATGVNHNTVINWVKQAASNLPDAPLASEIPEVTQIDELETFVGKKKQALAVDGCK